MTATTVNGVPVIRDEDTEAPIKNLRDGSPIYWTQTRTLTLADGSVVYGCLHCDATFDTKFKVRPHLGAKHTDPEVAAARRAKRVSAPSGALKALRDFEREALADVKALERQVSKQEKAMERLKERTETKVAKAKANEREALRRAQAAERSLQVLRDALGVCD